MRVCVCVCVCVGACVGACVCIGACVCVGACNLWTLGHVCTSISEYGRFKEQFKEQGEIGL